jgi:hypothetical protein
LELRIWGILPFNATLSYSNNHIENPKPNMIIGKKIFSSSKVIPFILNLHSKAQHTHTWSTHIGIIIYFVMIMCLLEIILSMLKFSKIKKSSVKVEDSKQLIILQTFAEFV